MKHCTTCYSEQPENQTSRFCQVCGSSSLIDVDPIENKEVDLDLFGDQDIALVLDPTKPQYKVITQKDRYFSQKFDSSLIERALNEYAQEGWTLVNAVSADFPGIGGGRNELVLFLEKKPNG